MTPGELERMAMQMALEDARRERRLYPTDKARLDRIAIVFAAAMCARGDRTTRRLGEKGGSGSHDRHPMFVV